MVLLQEEKFRLYHSQLAFVLKEYDRVMSQVMPVIKPLLRAHLDNLDFKIQPGISLLTWHSMNIDGYLHRIHTGLARFEELIHKINELIEHRCDFPGLLLLCHVDSDRTDEMHDDTCGSDDSGVRLRAIEDTIENILCLQSSSSVLYPVLKISSLLLFLS